MQAISYDVRLSTYFLGAAIGGAWPGLYHSRLSGLRLTDIPTPTRRGDDWALVNVTHAGVCGSDMAAVYYKTSPALTPFSSFPSVLGHEIVGRVREVGPAVTDFGVGDRVVVEPFLTCASRGIAVACEACRAGAYCLCHETATGPMAPGMIMGACRDHLGGWGEVVAAHRSQLFRLPDSLSDLEGALVEPLSIGVHAVLRKPPPPGARVLVIGSGMMAYAAIAALRLLDLDCHISHMSHLGYQKEAGLALGVDESLCAADGVEATARVQAITGARGHRPLIGRTVLTGGFDVVFDCVGSAGSLQDAFYFTRARGTIVLVGAPGRIHQLDWTFVWARELSVVGTLGYGVETWQGERLRTFDLTMRLMTKGNGSWPMATRRLDLAALVTHQFPLSAYVAALEANRDRAGTRSIKTVFTPSSVVTA